VLLDVLVREFLERPFAALGLLFSGRVLATGDRQHGLSREGAGVGEPNVAGVA
jgi:hypothetical protein